MRINQFQRIIIILKIFWVSASHTLRVFFGAVFLKYNYRDAGKTIHSWARKILKILRVQYSIINHSEFEFSDDRPYIIMSNHASHFDIPIIYSSFPEEVVGMIAKKELFRIPFFGRAMRTGGCVSIDRQNVRQALKDLVVAEKNMLSGVRIWIAPEGTRSRTGKIGKFKRGGFKIAMDTKAIIVPVTVVGSDKILPPDTLDFSINEKVIVHIGKPIDTNDYQGDMQRLILDTQQEITSYL